MRWVVILIGNFLTVIQAYEEYSLKSPEARLLHDVFDHQRQHIYHGRPIKNSSDTVVYYIGLEIIQLLALSMIDHTITITGFLRQEVHWFNGKRWKDEFITWKPEEYGNITQISVEPTTIWTPETVVYNSIDNPSSGDRFSDWVSRNIRTRINVSSTGDCVWLSPIAFESSCNFDVMKFPYDTHLCEIVFGPWSEMAFTKSLPDQKPAFTSNYLENGEWKLSSSSQMFKERFYECCDESFSNVIVSLQLTRKHLYYEFNYLLPFLFLIAVMLTAHWMPPDSGERITLSVTIMLAVIIMIHLSLAKQLPKQTAAVTIYSGVLLLEMTLSIIGNCFVMFLYNRPVETDIWIPHFLERLFVPDVFWQSSSVTSDSQNSYAYKSCNDDSSAVEFENIDKTQEKDWSKAKSQEYDWSRNRNHGNDCSSRQNPIFCLNSNADQKILKELELMNDKTYEGVLQMKNKVRVVYAAKIMDRFMFWALLIVGILAFLIIRFCYWNDHLENKDYVSAMQSSQNDHDHPM